MSEKNKQHLKEIGEMPKNGKSKNDDKKISWALAETFKTISINPDAQFGGYQYLYTPTASYETLALILKLHGETDDQVAYLLHKTEKGNFSFIKPDAGIIWAIKKDIYGNIEDIEVICSGEFKSQGGNDIKESYGNTEQRMFKNSNIFIDIITRYTEQTPYAVFGDGNAFKDIRVLNSVRGGCGFEINELIIDDIYINSNRKKRFPVMLRSEPWTEDEIYEIFLTIAWQRINFLKKKLPNIAI